MYNPESQFFPGLNPRPPRPDWYRPPNPDDRRREPDWGGGNKPPKIKDDRGKHEVQIKISRPDRGGGLGQTSMGDMGGQGGEDWGGQVSLADVLRGVTGPINMQGEPDWNPSIGSMDYPYTSLNQSQAAAAIRDILSQASRYSAYARAFRTPPPATFANTGAGATAPTGLEPGPWMRGNIF